MRTSLPLLLALGLLAACASGNAVSSGPEVPASAVATTDDFVAYLGTRGYLLRATSATTPFTLDVPGRAYEIQNAPGLIVVYEFASTAEAERELSALRPVGIRTSVYQRGPLIVAYTGAQSSVNLALTQALGPAVY
jgi:hypothetical protein